MFVESPHGFPPRPFARHYREPQRGRHRHKVCPPTGSGPCKVHTDRKNPDYADEMVPHLVEDFWPAHKHWIKPLAGAAAIGLVTWFLLRK